MAEGEDKQPRRRRRRPRRRGGSGGQSAQGGSAAQGGQADQSVGRGQGSQADSSGGRSQGDQADQGGSRSQGGQADSRSGRGRGGQRNRGGQRGQGGRKASAEANSNNASGARRRGRPRRTRTRSNQGSARGRSRRVRFGENWWARRWIEVLEDFQVGRRLGRGRSYARQGQVIDLELGKGFVTAKVQGSRDAPYLVRMHFSMLSSTDWKKMTRALGADADFAALLLAGEIPETIEDAFRDQELSLFPTASGDLKTACSCPDQANPCKHVAAVYYLLGEEFDRDPFLIFRLRGIERHELLDGIRSSAARHDVDTRPRFEAPVPEPRPEPEPELVTPEDTLLANEEDEPGIDGELDDPSDDEVDDDGADDAMAAVLASAPAEPAPVAREPEPLPSDAHEFWGAEVSLPSTDQVRIPSTPGALPRRLGGFPFWRGDADCAGTIEQIYRNASVAGLHVFLGQPGAHESQG